MATLWNLFYIIGWEILLIMADGARSGFEQFCGSPIWVSVSCVAGVAGSIMISRVSIDQSRILWLRCRASATYTAALYLSVQSHFQSPPPINLTVVCMPHYPTTITTVTTIVLYIFAMLLNSSTDLHSPVVPNNTIT